MTKAQILETLQVALNPRKYGDPTEFDNRRLRVDVEELAEKLEEDLPVKS